MQGLYMVSEVLMHFYWVIFSSFLQSGNCGQCVAVFFSEKWTFTSPELFTHFPGTFTFFAQLLDQYWEVLNQLSEKFNSQKVFSVSYIFACYFPACYKIVQCFLQDSLGFGLLTESPEKEHFRTLFILELVQIFIYMFYSLSTACQSKYCTCIS